MRVGCISPLLSFGHSDWLSRKRLTSDGLSKRFVAYADHVLLLRVWNIVYPAAPYGATPREWFCRCEGRALSLLAHPRDVLHRRRSIAQTMLFRKLGRLKPKLEDHLHGDHCQIDSKLLILNFRSGYPIPFLPGHQCDEVVRQLKTLRLKFDRYLYRNVLLQADPCDEGCRLDATTP